MDSEILSPGSRAHSPPQKKTKNERASPVRNHISYWLTRCHGPGRKEIQRNSKIPLLFLIETFFKKKCKKNWFRSIYSSARGIFFLVFPSGCVARIIIQKVSRSRPNYNCPCEEPLRTLASLAHSQRLSLVLCRWPLQNRVGPVQRNPPCGVIIRLRANKATIFRWHYYYPSVLRQKRDNCLVQLSLRYYWISRRNRPVTTIYTPRHN